MPIQIQQSQRKTEQIYQCAAQPKVNDQNGKRRAPVETQPSLKIELVCPGKNTEKVKMNTKRMKVQLQPTKSRKSDCYNSQQTVRACAHYDKACKLLGGTLRSE